MKTFLAVALLCGVSAAPLSRAHASEAECIARLDAVSLPGNHASNVEFCSKAWAHQRETVYNVVPHAASNSSSFSVPLNDIPNTEAVQYIHVRFNGVSYPMTVDTGCSNMTISPALADWLVANGQATEIGMTDIVLADGSTQTNRRILINSISIAGHAISNVRAAVIARGQAMGDMLIGIAVLQRFGKFTIDTASHQLIFG